MKNDAQNDSRASLSIMSPRYRMTTIGIVSLEALIAFEALAVATAMPTVVQDLGGMSSYALAFGITLATSVVGMTLGGGWSDRRGPEGPLWSGLACFLVGLLLAGFAQSMPVFLLGRLIQGLGVGGVSVALYVLVARRYPQALHRAVFAAFATAWVVPSLVGPVISGLVVEHFGWRWVFLSAPFLALAAAAMLRPALEDLPGLAPGRTESGRRGLLAAGAAAGVCLLYIGGQARGVAAVAMLGGAAALSAGCTWKLLPPGTLLASQGLPSVIALRGLVFAAFFGAEAFLALMLADERGLTAPMVGLVLSAGAVGWCCASWYQGHRRNGWSRHRFLRTGTGAICAGLGMTFSGAWPAVPLPLIAVGWAVAGIGMGLVHASLSLVTLSMSAPDQQGTNSSALQLSEAIAVATSLALGGSLFTALQDMSAQLAYLANFAIAGTMAVMAALVVGRTNTRQVFVN